MRNSTRLPESSTLLQRRGRCARVCTCFIIIYIIIFSKILLCFHDVNGLLACVRVCVCLSSSRPPSSLGWLAVWCSYCRYVCMCACVHARTHTTINTHEHNICVHIDVHKRISVHIDECVSLVCRWQGAMGRHLSIRDVVRRKSITRRQCRTD